MAIMDMFRTAVQSTPPPNPAQLPTPGNIPPGAGVGVTATTSATAPNGTVPTGSADAPVANPLDEFKSLWENPANPNPNTGSYFNIDVAALNAAAAQQDFTSSITAEQLKKIATGGEEAVAAFAEAMNSVSRDVYAKAALATTKIVDTALGKADQRMKDNLPAMIKNHNLSNDLRTENPAFSHPAAQPVIEALKSQIILKYPNASETELRSMATNYLSAMFTAAVPAKADAGTSKGGKGSGAKIEVDWSKFVE